MYNRCYKHSPLRHKQEPELLTFCHKNLQKPNENYIAYTVFYRIAKWLEIVVTLNKVQLSRVMCCGRVDNLCNHWLQVLSGITSNFLLKFQTHPHQKPFRILLDIICISQKEKEKRTFRKSRQLTSFSKVRGRLHDGHWSRKGHSCQMNLEDLDDGADGGTV